MVHAIAKVTIEIGCKSSWSKDTTMDQIFRQAKEDAEGFIRNLPKEVSRHIKIHGDFEITAIHVEQKK